MISALIMLHWLLLCCLKVNGKAFLAAGEREGCVSQGRPDLHFGKCTLFSGGLPIIFCQYWRWTFFVVENSPVLCTQAALWLPHLFFHSICVVPIHRKMLCKLYCLCFIKNINIYIYIVLRFNHNIQIIPKVSTHCSKTCLSGCYRSIIQ